jgi:hypothetical protein
MKITDKNIRDSYHVIIGFAIGYFCLKLFGFNTTNFPLGLDYLNNYLFLVVPALCGGAIGFFWEKWQEEHRRIYSDMKDVIRTAVGGVLGGILEMFWGNWIFAIVMVVISIVIVIKHYKK